MKYLLLLFTVLACQCAPTEPVLVEVVLYNGATGAFTWWADRQLISRMTSPYTTDTLLVEDGASLTCRYAPPYNAERYYTETAAEGLYWEVP